MPRYRALVTIRTPAQMPEDWISNSVYFDDANSVTDAAGLAADIATLYATYRSYPNTVSEVNVRMYDMAEPTPREIQGESTANIAVRAAEAGPREVALCLSFYSDRNLPRNRGRVYVGPWASSQMTERPSSVVINQLVTLGEGLANIGGIDVDWSVYSPSTVGSVDDKFKSVSDLWVDNEWDTVRSRGLKPTTREARQVNE